MNQEKKLADFTSSEIVCYLLNRADLTGENEAKRLLYN